MLVPCQHRGPKELVTAPAVPSDSRGGVSRMKTASLVFLSFIAASSTLFAAGPVTALVGATLIDGTGSAPVKDAVVVVEGAKIVAAGPRGRVSIPAGARQLNVAGKYVIPGLMDANVHLVLGTSIEFIVRYEGRYEELIEEAAQIGLKNGLTTVFD